MVLERSVICLSWYAIWFSQLNECTTLYTHTHTQTAQCLTSVKHLFGQSCLFQNHSFHRGSGPGSLWFPSHSVPCSQPRNTHTHTNSVSGTWMMIIIIIPPDDESEAVIADRIISLCLNTGLYRRDTVQLSQPYPVSIACFTSCSCPPALWRVPDRLDVYRRSFAAFVFHNAQGA